MTRHSEREPRLPSALAHAALGGALGTAVGCLLAVVGLAGAAFYGVRGGDMDWGGLGALAWYVLGFAGGGALAGLLVPVRERVGGSYGMGMAATAVVVFAIARSQEGPVRGWSGEAWAAAAVATVVFGVAAGLVLERMRPPS